MYITNVGSERGLSPLCELQRKCVIDTIDNTAFIKRIYVECGVLERFESTIQGILG